MIKMTTTPIQFSELKEILDNSIALRLENGILVNIGRWQEYYILDNTDDSIDILEDNIEKIQITTNSEDLFSVTILLKNPNHNHLTGSKEVSFIPLVKMKKR